LAKLEELDLSQPANDETTTTLISFIDQLQHKAESIQQLDGKIQAIIENLRDIESDVIDLLEFRIPLLTK